MKLKPCLAFDKIAEFLSVFCLAHGGCRHGSERASVHPFGEALKTTDRAQGTGAPRGIEAACFSDTFAKAAHNLFVEEIGWATRGAIKDHKTDRVGADIYNANA